MSKVTSPYDSITFGNPLSLRVDSNYLSIMSISPWGRDAVLAGRKGLLIVDLDDPFAAPRWLHHETSWEVADVQWSPHVSKPSWVVSTSNQKAMVWNLARSSTDAIEYVLHSHRRAITDIHFHPQNPEILATCSVDSFVLAWDLRCPKRPVYQWSDWRSAASQVKWNYQDPNIIASSHNSNIQIWDIRKGAIPMKSIEAHDAKINGLDWSRENKYELISSSNDMSVKFWSFDKEYEKPVYTIRTDFPVSKTRHVPFGNHVCGIMPLRGGNNSIYMVDYKDKVGEDGLHPSYVFKGHTEPLKDFVWRSRHTPNTTIDDSEYQLVTWASDSDLRLWPLNDDIYKSIDFKRNQPLKEGQKLKEFEYRSYRAEPQVSSDNKLIIRYKHKGYQSSSYADNSKNTNSEFNHLNWISGIKIGQSAFQHVDNDPNSATYGDNSNQPLNLGEEFSNVGHKFPKLRFERISVSTGVLVLSLNGPWSSESKDELIFIRIEFNFPKGYPAVSAVPKFKIEDTHELTSDKKQEILKKLQEISAAYCSHNRFCLEPCLRYLLGEKVDLDFELEESLDSYGLDYKEINNDYDDDLLSISPCASSSENDINVADIKDEEEEEDDDDDDEDDDGGGYHNRVQDMNKKKGAFDSTPVSKGCGAIWTPSGHLVCFFISKGTESDQHLIKFGQQGFSLVRNLKRKHVQDGMQLGDEKYDTNNLNESDTDSDSSSDSLSNDFDVFQGSLYRTKVPDLLRNVNIDSRQYSSKAKSNILSDRSITNTSKTSPSKNVIRIYDFRYLIPIKMELAYEYRVLGDAPHILAEHNALVAEKYGYKTIANCWKILSVILLKDVTVDEGATTALLQKFGEDANNFELLHNYRFYWGFHPFGGIWLVKQLFEYFKKVNDIQMLAMLSCILFENHDTQDDANPPINSLYFAKHAPMGLKKSNLRKNSNTFANQRNGSTMSTMRSIVGKFNKSSPLAIHNPSSVSFNRKYSRSVHSYNTISSPINLSQYRMPSVSTLSSYEFDSRSFKSSSPAGTDMNLNNNVVPSNNRRGIKHQGNNGIEYPNINGLETLPNSSLVTAAPPMGLQLSRTLSTSSANIFAQHFAKTLNLSNVNNEDKNLTEEEPRFKLEMKNVTKLDLYEERYCVNIEGFVDPKELNHYRSEYASILFCWGLPANRLKILKFNYNYSPLSKSRNKPSDFQEHHGEIGWCEGLQIEQQDKPKVKWNKTHDKNKCNYCQLKVTKRLSVCTRCNHIMHDVCAIEWWEKNQMDECPSGCGCECLNQKRGL